MKSINDQWKEFAEKIKLNETGPIQQAEMKRAFFAGWTSALMALNLEVTQLPEDEGMKQLERFEQELRGFAIAIQMGAA